MRRDCGLNKLFFGIPVLWKAWFHATCGSWKWTGMERICGYVGSMLRVLSDLLGVFGIFSSMHLRWVVVTGCDIWNGRNVS